jgi:hypothetical protein
MPLIGPASFIPLAEEILAHWSLVDEALKSEGPLKLRGEFDRGSFEGLCHRLRAAKEAVARARLRRSIERRDLGEHDELLAHRVSRFNREIGAGQICLTPEEAAALWHQIELTEGPRVLGSSYVRLDFVTDLAARKMMIAGIASAERALAAARSERNELQLSIRSFVMDYRDEISAWLPPQHPLLKTLPAMKLLKGKPPTPVEVKAEWDAAGPRLRWSPSRDPHLHYYEVRAVVGEPYEFEDEDALARIQPEGPFHWELQMPLEEPGNHASFRVYTVALSGHESGSAPVTLTRP